MSKRRRASELIYGRSHGFKYPVAVVPYLTGTGTETGKGTLMIIASNVATRCYVSFAATGTLVGTASGGF
jgi:hypothetical protein